MEKLRQKFIFFTLFSLSISLCFGNKNIDTRVREYISPVKLVWLSDSTGQYVKHPEVLLNPGNGQAEISGNLMCSLENSDGHRRHTYRQLIQPELSRFSLPRQDFPPYQRQAL